MVLAVSAFAADVTGKWKASFEGPQGPLDLMFTFKTEGDKVTGTVASPMGDLPLSDIKIDGDQITFTVSTDQFSVVHTGTGRGRRDEAQGGHDGRSARDGRETPALMR